MTVPGIQDEPGDKSGSKAMPVLFAGSQPWMPHRSWFGLREKLVMLVLGVALISMLAAAGAFLFVSQRYMETSIESHLASVARLHAQRIDEFMNFLTSELRLISSRTQLRQALADYVDRRDPAALEQVNLILSDAKRSVSSFENILLYGIDGKLITSISALSLESQLLDSSMRDKLLGNYQVTSTIIGAEGRRLLQVGGPMMDGNRAIGILVVLTSMEPLRAAASGSGGWISEELIITEADANGHDKAITPLRFAMAEDVPPLTLTQIKDQDKIKSDERNLLSGKDYRGVAVLASTQILKNPAWTIMVKIDQDDAFRPIRDQRDLWLAMMMLVLVLVAIVGVWLSSYFTMPILGLAEVAVMIASGDFKRRMQHFSRDELGMLSYSVNRMADKLVDVSAELETQLRLQHERADRLNDQLIHANNELHWLSRTDSLTKLFNRRTLEETLENEWLRAIRTGHSLAAIMLDLDFFKSINDISGHASGDECLRRVGSVLKETVQRSGDFVARYGGEEFVILVIDANIEHACTFAERIRTRLAEEAIPHPSSDLAPVVTASMGITSMVPSNDRSPQELLDLADRALYLAKARGRNRIETVSPD